MSRRHKNTASVQTADAEKHLTTDAFSNALFRLGYGSQAPIEATQYPLTRMTDDYALLNSLYRSNWVVQNIVDLVPADMLREWFTLSGESSPDALAAFDRVCRNTRLRTQLERGLRWGRLYGGAAGLILIKGQDDLSRPLDIDTILPNTYQGLYILDRWSGITPDMELVDDPSDADYNLPAWYTVTGVRGEIVARVHHSRVVRFTGHDLVYLEQVAEMGWGESEIEAAYDDVRKHNNVAQNMANLTFKANRDVQSVQNLDQLFSLGGTAAQKRFWDVMQAQSVMESNFGTRLINEGDSVQTMQYNFAGLRDVYESMCLDLSGATRIPVTKLFGRSPAGMNATGESDMRNYYDYIDTQRENKLRPTLERILPVLCMSAWGEMPEDVGITFPPLWTPTAKEVAEIAKSKAETILNVFQAGLLDAAAAMRELKKLNGETGLFDGITEDDIASMQGKTYQDLTALRDPLAGIE